MTAPAKRCWSNTASGYPQQWTTARSLLMSSRNVWATQSTPQLLQLRAALETLPRRDADLVALRFGAELSNLEIAELWNMTPGAVAVTVHRALGRLRTEIGLKGDSDART